MIRREIIRRIMSDSSRLSRASAVLSGGLFCAILMSIAVLLLEISSLWKLFSLTLYLRIVYFIAAWLTWFAGVPLSVV
jgi:hypothetical protein